MKKMRREKTPDSMTDVLLKVAAARLLVPVDVKDGRYSLNSVADSKGRRFVIAFSDTASFEIGKKDDDQQAVLSSFEDLISVSLDPAFGLSGLIINPGAEEVMFGSELLKMIDDQMKGGAGGTAAGGVGGGAADGAGANGAGAVSTAGSGVAGGVKTGGANGGEAAAAVSDGAEGGTTQGGDGSSKSAVNALNASAESKNHLPAGRVSIGLPNRYPEGLLEKFKAFCEDDERILRGWALFAVNDEGDARWLFIVESRAEAGERDYQFETLARFMTPYLEGIAPVVLDLADERSVLAAHGNEPVFSRM